MNISVLFVSFKQITQNTKLFQLTRKKIKYQQQIRKKNSGLLRREFVKLYWCVRIYYVHSAYICP